MKTGPPSSIGVGAADLRRQLCGDVLAALSFSPSPPGIRITALAAS